MKYHFLLKSSSFSLLTKLWWNLSRKPQINRKNNRKTFSKDKDNNKEGHLASVIRHSCLRLDCQSSNSLDTNKP
jgi:hypothetical protein